MGNLDEKLRVLIDRITTLIEMDEREAEEQRKRKSALDSAWIAVAGMQGIIENMEKSGVSQSTIIDARDAMIAKFYAVHEIIPHGGE